MVITICNEKGGSGKSTIAINLASFLGLKNKKVLIIDSDPQNSINVFANIRADENLKENFSSISKVGSSLKDTILEMKKNFDFIIIDTGGRDNKEMRQSMILSDKIIIPTIPSQLDLNVFLKMIEIFENCNSINEKVQGYIIINKTTTNPFLKDKETSSVIEYIKDCIKDKENIKLINTMISERLIYKKSVVEGKSIFELQDEKAKDEFKSFIDELNLNLGE